MIAVTNYGYAIGGAVLAVAIVVGVLGRKVDGITKWNFRVRALGLDSIVEAGAKPGEEITVGGLVETANRALELAQSADERSQRIEAAMEAQRVELLDERARIAAEHLAELEALHSRVAALEDALSQAHADRARLEAELAVTRARIAELELELGLHD